MQINITGHHVDVTDGIREAVKQKFSKLENHFPDIQTIDVIVTVEKHRQTAEANTHFLGKDFSAKAINDDMYKSIAEMTTKLTALMQKQKEQVKTHSHDKIEVDEPEVDTDDELDEAV